MVIRPSKGFETNSDFPNSNWYENEPDNVVIDETTEEGQALAQKVKRLYPNYKAISLDGFVTDIEEILPTDPDYIAPAPIQPTEIELLTQRADEQDELLMSLIFGGAA